MALGIGIGVGFEQPKGSIAPVSDWILDSGFWVDSGFWRDTAVWED